MPVTKGSDTTGTTAGPLPSRATKGVPEAHIVEAAGAVEVAAVREEAGVGECREVHHVVAHGRAHPRGGAAQRAEDAEGEVLDGEVAASWRGDE